MLTAEQKVWVGLRLSLGFIFFWAFLDKLLGLGFSTAAAKSWLAGGSPTAGFLGNAAGLLAPMFKAMAGSVVVDVLFMAGLGLIGIALLLGIANRIAGYAGALLMFLMWLASILPKTNPILDDHIVYLIALLGIAVVQPGKWWGLGERWAQSSIVKRFPILA